jgi:hypothetical protein
MDLILLVCLVASPQTCREERVLVSYAQIESRACMAGAAPAIAEWSEDHPEWQVSRWSCGAPQGSRLSRNLN